MPYTAWNRALALAGSLALVVPSALAGIQEALTMADVLGGKKFALTIKPADLPETYKPVRLKTAGASGGGLMDMFSAMLSPVTMLMGGGNQDAQGATLMAVADLSWTQGDVVKVHNKDFVVTYKWNLDLSQMMAGGQGGDTPEAKSAVLKDMELSLTLVAMDGLVTLSPATGFTKADLIKIINTPITPKETGAVPPEAKEAEEQLTLPVPSEESSMDPEQATLGNIKQVGLGTMMYATDWDDSFPYVQGTKAVQYVTYPYMKSFDLWTSHNPNKSQFLFNMALAGVRMGSVAKPSETVMFYESKAWPSGSRAVCFADGHGALLSREEWSQVSGTLKLKMPKIGKPLPADWGKDFKPGRL